MIPLSPKGKCPDKMTAFYFKKYNGKRVFSCFCEDHCRWDKCFLSLPPPKCIADINSKWLWDPDENYWVARVLKGTDYIRSLILHFIRKF